MLSVSIQSVNSSKVDPKDKRFPLFVTMSSTSLIIEAKISPDLMLESDSSLGSLCKVIMNSNKENRT